MFYGQLSGGGAMAQAELPAVEVAVVDRASTRHSLDQHLQAEIWASSSRRKWILEQMGDAHPDNIGVDTGVRRTSMIVPARLLLLHDAGR